MLTTTDPITDPSRLRPGEGAGTVLPPVAAPGGFTADDVLAAHRGGKLSVALRAPIVNRRDLSMLYTPGVAGVSSLIADEPSAARDYTWASRVMMQISMSPPSSATNRSPPAVPVTLSTPVSGGVPITSESS